MRTIHRFRLLALMLGAAFALAPAALARPVRHAHVVTGKLYPVRVYASRHSASAHALAPSASGLAAGYVRGARPIPRSSSTAAPLTAKPPAAGSDTLAAGAATGTLQEQTSTG